MPNWCYNSVTFSGPQKKLEELSNLIKVLENKENLENRGVIPDFIENDPELMSKDDMLYMFDIYYSEDFFDFISFSSKWTPTLFTIYEIGKKIGVSFKHYYDESSNMIYGVASYNHETEEYYNICLNDSDFDEIGEHDDEEGGFSWYTFEGKDYEVKEDILEILLERKVQNN